ncbi:hypothetical protein JVT61DRAFT_14060 [Boletus reticuloceps]|uniref:Xylanolytic transcriptional activator regulatory domain-containing protein n=1 Tax=Boletus reticuloceps TaxID=495285 RepID=A0A8I3ADC8_9AGAM|nr:hypothetical protein JVT61DRAFT_14060 [Boletus reticuloceps]
MEGFQFIIESPQEAQSQKKRPRLVTSCDNCVFSLLRSPNAKHAKSQRPSADFEIESVTLPSAVEPLPDPASHVQLAELDTQLTTPPAGLEVLFQSFPAPNAPPGSPLPMQRSSSYSPSQPTGYNDGHVRYQSYPLDPAKSPGSHNGHRATQSCSGILYGTLLFEPGHPPSPQRVWMQQFIQLFISNMGGQCPFLSYDDIYDKFRRQTLPPLLSNCIATLGARFSDIPEVVSRGSQTVAEIYSDMAKEQLSTSLQQPSVETLQAAILLAWAEYKSGRGHGFRQYSDLATQTAMAIGLSEESSLQLSPYDPYQNRLRITWSSLSQLRLYASSMAAQKLG